MVNRWNPEHCNFEEAGSGLINAADWNCQDPPASFPSGKELLSRFSSELKTHPKVELLLSHKGGMGDTLMCSTVAHELRRRGVKNIWLETRWNRDFSGQSVFDGVLKESYETEWLVERLGGRIVYPRYARVVPGEDREIGPSRHILAEMCREAGITGEITARPYFDAPAESSLKLPDKFIAIGVLGSHGVLTKNWFIERFQELGVLLNKEFMLVQMGSKSEPLLPGVIDLRGRTDVREASAVLKKAQCFIGQVGGLMHLARAVECPSVIIYGGREAPEQSGYSANINLVGPVPCSPCWIIKRCPYDMACMDVIEPVDVIAGLRRMLDRNPSRPLPADTFVIE